MVSKCFHVFCLTSRLMDWYQSTFPFCLLSFSKININGKVWSKHSSDSSAATSNWISGLKYFFPPSLFLWIFSGLCLGFSSVTFKVSHKNCVWCLCKAARRGDSGSVASVASAFWGSKLPFVWNLSLGKKIPSEGWFCKVDCISERSASRLWCFQHSLHTTTNLMPWEKAPHAPKKYLQWMCVLCACRGETQVICSRHSSVRYLFACITFMLLIWDEGNTDACISELNIYRQSLELQRYCALIPAHHCGACILSLRLLRLWLSSL